MRILRGVPRRWSSTVAWPCNSWGEADRTANWRTGNWGKNHDWKSCTLTEPTSVQELQEIVKKNKKVRVVGSGHSFSPLVHAGDQAKPTLINLRKMPRFWQLDEANSTLTVESSATYSEICHALSKTKYALPNTASLPQFQVAAAVATGTHGSSGMGKDGRLLRSGLADAVVALEIIGPDGSLRTVRKGDADFTASVISLGLMGIVTKVSLTLIPDFDIAQRVYGRWPPAPSGTLSALIEALPTAMEQCTSFSSFLRWNVDDFGMLILRQEIPRGATPAAASPSFARQPLLERPITGFLEGADYETTSKGRWMDKLHVWMRDTKPFGPQSGPELQMAHFVPMKFCKDALIATRHVAAKWGSDVLYCELRAVRGDNHLLSPYTSAESPGDTLAISHGMDGRIGQENVLKRAAELEDALRHVQAKPHWAKLTAISPTQVQRLYGDRLTKFKAVRAKVDPEKKFSNSYLERLLGF